MENAAIAAILTSILFSVALKAAPVSRFRYWKDKETSAASMPAKIHDYTRAVEAWRKGDGIDDLAGAYFGRGLCYRREMKSTEAIADFSAAIRLIPDYADAYLERGSAYLSEKNYHKAEADFGKVIEFNPIVATGYIGRSEAYAGEKEYDRAIADLKTALRLEPRDPRLFRALDGLYEKRRQSRK